MVAKRPKNRSKLDAIIKQQKQILSNEKKMQRKTDKIERLEEQAVAAEKDSADSGRLENNELAKLEALEKEVKAQVSPHPLRNITFKDFTKGIVGAFVGVVVHFTFTYGVELADHISTARASFLLLFSFLIGALFLYGTGFRKINDSILWLLPYRIIVLYATSILVTIGTLAFFYPHFTANPELAYRQIATVNLSAVIGACTADLIGRD